MVAPLLPMIGSVLFLSRGVTLFRSAIRSPTRRLGSSVSYSNVAEQIRQEATQEMQRVVAFYQTSDVHNPPELLTTRDQVLQFLQDIDTILFDCDGVLYRSPEAIPGAAECIRSLLLGEKNKQVLFVTNNAASNRRQLRDKLTEILRVEHDLLTPEMMVSSSYACAVYLQQKLPGSSCKIFVIGSQGLCEELRQSGGGSMNVVAPRPDEPYSMSRDELAAYDFSLWDADEPVDAVVVGHDTEYNFRKLCLATVLLQRNPQALLVATNMDTFDLVGADGRHIPGNGSLVRSIEYASRREAINVGKPSQTLIDLMVKQFGINVNRTLIVGDRLDTDIRLGADSGMRSALVLTGVTKAATLRQLQGGSQEEPLPTVIIPHVGLFA